MPRDEFEHATLTSSRPYFAPIPPPSRPHPVNTSRSRPDIVITSGSRRHHVLVSFSEEGSC